MDETGISTVPNNPPKVISTKGKRCVNNISSPEREINVTLITIINAAGNFFPPAFTFSRKRMKAELLDETPPCSTGMVSDTSHMNRNLFLDWLLHFKNPAKLSRENPVLLILDNHASDSTLGAVKFFCENHIHALTTPPHIVVKLRLWIDAFLTSSKYITLRNVKSGFVSIQEKLTQYIKLLLY